MILAQRAHRAPPVLPARKVHKVLPELRVLKALPEVPALKVPRVTLVQQEHRGSLGHKVRREYKALLEVPAHKVPRVTLVQREHRGPLGHKVCKEYKALLVYKVLLVRKVLLRCPIQTILRPIPRLTMTSSTRAHHSTRSGRGPMELWLTVRM